MTDHPSQKEWLGLGEAAQYLGIHPVTLRRWADAGDINYMLTVGRHRRFAITELKRFAEERLRLMPLPRTEQLWADSAAAHTQEVIQSHRQSAWMQAYSDSDRQQSRELGRRLMAIVLQYISSDENSEILLEEARAIGEQYAHSAIEHGLAITDVLEATMSFRDAMFEAAILVPEVAHTAPKNNARLLKKINTLLNTVQLAVASVYDRQTK
ncbi:MAG: helix-turn-helix domain-containing protein [Chloroflexi bacterium]|nr:helix-turn-helix domain-containing protein [Chloroflexota bacterium]